MSVVLVIGLFSIGALFKLQPQTPDHLPDTNTSGDVLGAVGSNDLTISNQILAVVKNADGTVTIQYKYVLSNLSDYLIYDLHATSRFNHSTPGLFVINSLTSDPGLNLNSGYNGMSDTNLLAGANTLAAHTSKTIYLSITLKYDESIEPFINYVDTSGQSDGGTASASSSSTPTSSSTTTIPSSSTSSGTSTPVGTSSISSSATSSIATPDPVSTSSSASTGSGVSLFASAQVTFDFSVEALPQIGGGKGI